MSVQVIFTACLFSLCSLGHTSTRFAPLLDTLVLTMILHVGEMHFPSLGVVPHSVLRPALLNSSHWSQGCKLTTSGGGDDDDGDIAHLLDIPSSISVLRDKCRAHVHHPLYHSYAYAMQQFAVSSQEINCSPCPTSPELSQGGDYSYTLSPASPDSTSSEMRTLETLSPTFSELRLFPGIGAPHFPRLCVRLHLPFVVTCKVRSRLPVNTYHSPRTSGVTFCSSVFAVPCNLKCA